MAKRSYVLIFFLLSCSVQAAIVSIPLNSFNAGELSPLMEARSDFTKYNNACKRLNNMFPLAQGPVIRRPGTKYIAETETMTEKSRLIPFEFSRTDAYILEFGDLYMRIYRNGGQVLSSTGTEDMTSPVDVSASVVSQWKLNDDDANTHVDDTAENHDGVLTPSNTADITATGKINDCLDFGGNQAAEINDHANLSFGNGTVDSPFSIIAWVYVTPHTLGQMILTKWKDATAREWKFAVRADERLQLALEDESTDAQIKTASVDALSSGWHFVAVTYTGQSTTGSTAANLITLYVEGVAVSSTAFNNSDYDAMENLTTKMVIGANYSSGGSLQNYFQDKIDNVVLFDVKLTPTQIDSLHVETTAYKLTTTYTEDEVEDLQYVQLADVMYIAHPDHEPRKLERTGHTDWTIADVNYIDGPFIAENTDTSITVTPSATTGTITLDSNSDIFSPGLVGALWEIRHPRADATLNGILDANESSSAIACEGDYKLTTHGTWSGTVKLERTLDDSTYETVYAVNSADDTNIDYAGDEPDSGYKYRVTMTEYSSTACTYSFIVYDHMHSGAVRIASYVDPNEVTATVHTTLGGTTATYYWSEGYFSPTNGYPRTVEFHQFRLWFGGNMGYPQTLWASKSGDTTDYESMSEGTDDDDALVYTLPNQNPIQFLHSYETLVIGTLGGVGRLGDPDEPITPTTAPVYRQQTPYGSEFIPAVSAGDAVLYVGRGGSKVREFAYSLERDRFVSPDLTVLAEHITGDGIIDVAYQIRPDSVLWCVLADGDLATMTYLRENDVFAWSLQVTDGDFESVAIIPGDDEDEVWVTVNRTIDDATARYIEQFQPRDWGSDDNDAWFVDSGLNFDGGDSVNISAVTKADPGVVTVTSWPTDGDGTDLADDDQVKILTVVGMTELNGNIYTVDDADSTALTFSLNNSANTANVDTTNYTTYSSGGTVQRFEKDFSNLDHLEGEVVAVYGDGAVQSSQTVDSNAIELSNWHNKVLIGLPFTSIIETMPLVFNTRSGSTSAKYKKILNVSFDFYETLGLSFGIDSDNLKIEDFDDVTTGWKEWNFPFGKMRSATVYVETSKPIPLTIRQIIPELEIDD